MPVTLVRRSTSVDVHDADAVRDSLKESVALEVKLKGQPITKLIFFADGYEEVLELTTAIRDDGSASMGATFQVLRRRPEVERAFVVMRMDNLPPTAPAPTTAKMMVELAAQLAVGDLLKGAVKGTVVVRYAQRVWEMWVLGDDMPNG